MFSAALYAHVRTSLCTLHMRSRVQRASGIPCSLVLGRNGFAEPGHWAAGMRRCVPHPELSSPRRRGDGFTFEVQQLGKKDLGWGFEVKAFPWGSVIGS